MLFIVMFMFVYGYVYGYVPYNGSSHFSAVTIHTWFTELVHFTACIEI